MDLKEIQNVISDSEDLHLVRILLLLGAFEDLHQKGINGITKLAKLDFLLRYPKFFRIALEKRGMAKSKLPPRDIQERSIESTMVRYRFGPWDYRYRARLNMLVGKNLVTVSLQGKKVTIELTKSGKELCVKLQADTAFSDIYDRGIALAKYLDLGSRHIMEFIYDTFPEISTLELGEEISQ